jgi:hypothetical protein
VVVIGQTVVNMTSAGIQCDIKAEILGVDMSTVDGAAIERPSNLKEIKTHKG